MRPARLSTFGVSVLLALGAMFSGQFTPASAAAGTEADQATQGCVSAGYMTVRETGELAQITAGHCSLAEEDVYERLFGGMYDIALVRLGAVPPPVDYTAHLTATWSMAIGTTLCSNSGSSGPRCGPILALDYSPSYVPGSYGFILVDAPCANGDSGGAWLDETGGLAGVQSGARGRTGQCIVSPVNDLDGLYGRYDFGA